MYFSRVLYIAIVFPSGICSMQAQKVDHQQQRFGSETKQPLPPELDSVSVSFDRDYREWLKNEPPKVEVPELTFHDYLQQRFSLTVPMKDAPPKSTFCLDTKALQKELGIYQMSPNLSFVTHSFYNQVPGLAQSITANFNLIYHKKNLTINGGMMLGKYQNFIWNSNVATFHMGAEYQLNNRISLGVQGSYVPNVGRVGPNAIFSPTNSYGAYAKVRINSWLSLMPAIRRYYDPIAGRWNTSFFVMPVIDFGRLLNFQSHKKMTRKERLKRALENY